MDITSYGCISCSWITQALNLFVKKAIEQTTEFDQIRTSMRNFVAYFRTSRPAKERLQVQEQMGLSVLKLIQEVDTDWNSTFTRLHSLCEQRERVTVDCPCQIKNFYYPTEHWRVSLHQKVRRSASSIPAGCCIAVRGKECVCLQNDANILNFEALIKLQNGKTNQWTCCSPFQYWN